MLQHDLRMALRWLRRSPGFSLAASLVLALGIGAATATFTVIHAVMLRPLPFHQPDRVIRIWSSPEGRNLPFFSVSAPDVADWRARTRALSIVASYDRQRALTIAGGAVPEQVIGAGVSRELFEVLGVRPALGRWFESEEDRTGSGARVAVIGDGVWQRRFGGRRDVIGQTLRLDDQPFTVIGVMPRGFAIPNNPAEVWLPLQLTIDADRRSAGRFLRVLARLRDGVTVEEATRELQQIAASLAREHPASNHAWTVTVRPLTETVVGETFQRALLVAAGAVGLVLLIACANVASLLLSRATTRRGEMAVRRALGASRPALIRQLLIESLVVAAGGGVLGVLLAMWGLDVLAALAVTTIPRAEEIAVRPAVLLFAVALAAATPLLFGLAPALGASRASAESLRVRDGSDGRGATRMRDLLVGAEIALAVVLLVGAGLMMRSFVRLQQRDLGFEPGNLLLVDVAPPRTSPASLFYDRLAGGLAAVPGVEAVAGGSRLPFAGPNSANVVAVEGRSYAPGTEPDADYRIVTPNYFRALGIPLLRGRTFAEVDTPAHAAAIVSATLSRTLLAGEDPIGRRIRFRGTWLTIVGVVGDARYLGLDDPRDDVRPMVYLPVSQNADAAQTIVLKTAVPPASLVSAARATVRRIAPAQPIVRIESMEAILAATRGPHRFNSTILGVFAWIALVLAAAGLWASISHGVARRRREIGIRVALGARSGDVLRTTAARGVALALAGIVVGLLAARALNQVLAALLFNVSATDPATFATIAVAFVAVALAASLLPARRALQIDPAEALRLE